MRMRLLIRRANGGLRTEDIYHEDPMTMRHHAEARLKTGERLIDVTEVPTVPIPSYAIPPQEMRSEIDPDDYENREDSIRGYAHDGRW